MTYRDDVAALAARQASLAHEVATKQRELAETSQLLDDARSRASLPILDNLRIASPCKASWAGMTGNERIRHCGDCKKDVYNLSGMTRDQAHELLASRNDLCVRYYQRKDGTILLADCEVGQRRTLRKHLIVAGAAVASLATAAGAAAHILASCHEEPEVRMGSVGTMPEDPTPPRVRVTVEPIQPMRDESQAGAHQPERLTTAMIDRAITPSLAEIQSCGTSYATNEAVRVRVSVRADGLVSTVSLVDHVNDALGDCVGNRIRQLHFDSTDYGGTFIYPFTFRH